MKNKFNATESLRNKGVETLSSGGETKEWSIQLSVILQELYILCDGNIALLVNEYLIRLAHRCSQRGALGP